MYDIPTNRLEYLKKLLLLYHVLLRASLGSRSAIPSSLIYSGKGIEHNGVNERLACWLALVRWNVYLSLGVDGGGPVRRAKGRATTRTAEQRQQEQTAQ